jgi:hypothetical protein
MSYAERRGAHDVRVIENTRRKGGFEMPQEIAKNGLNNPRKKRKKHVPSRRRERKGTHSHLDQAWGAHGEQSRRPSWTQKEKEVVNNEGVHPEPVVERAAEVGPGVDEVGPLFHATSHQTCRREPERKIGERTKVWKERLEVGV